MTIDHMRNEASENKNDIYMNNAGASLRPPGVTDTIKAYLDFEDQVGGHRAAELKSSEIASVYSSIATLLNASVQEIALMESHTIAWHACLSAFDFIPGDEVIISRAEYISGLMAVMELRKKSGIVVHIIDYDEAGLIDLNQLEKFLSDKTRLVCLTHISTSNGQVHPVAEAGRLINNNSDAFYLLDACQSIGARVVDVKKIGCHGLTATGRKYLRGPRGTGFLFIEKSWQQRLRPRFPDGHKASMNSSGAITPNDNATQFETYEKSLANVLGMGAAIDYALDIGMEKIENRINLLSTHFIKNLNAVDGIIVGEHSHIASGIVTISSNQMSAKYIYDQLMDNNVVCKFINTVGGAWDAVARDRGDVVRLSLHYFNTTDECDTVCGLLPVISRAQ